MEIEAHRTRLRTVIAEQPFPLVFVTISGAHLYGFASPDSDFDLRGMHVLPLRDVLGLGAPRETVEVSELREGLEIDLVSHDARKFMGMMLKRNGYVLEQLLSPLVLHTSPEHVELIELGKRCITRHHAHHYVGFAENQWELFSNESPRRIKPLLYFYRVALTGIHLMHSGEIQANLVSLNDEARLSHVTDLIARKTATSEQARLGDDEYQFHEAEHSRLLASLRAAAEATHLPENVACRDGLSDLLYRIRLKLAAETNLPAVQ